MSPQCKSFSFLLLLLYLVLLLTLHYWRVLHFCCGSMFHGTALSYLFLGLNQHFSSGWSLSLCPFFYHRVHGFFCMSVHYSAQIFLVSPLFSKVFVKICTKTYGQLSKTCFLFWFPSNYEQNFTFLNPNGFFPVMIHTK